MNININIHIDDRIIAWIKKAINKRTAVIVTVAAILCGGLVYSATISKPFTFSAGTTISSSQVNANFDALYTQVNSLDARLGAIDANVALLNSAKAVPAGTVIIYAGSNPPAGYLLCDGNAVSRTEYADLYAAILTTYGAGDGSTTFNLPDFRGIFPKGAGTTSRIAGKNAIGNFYAGTLGVYSQDRMQGHYHNWDGMALKGGSPAVYQAGADHGIPASNGVRDATTDGTNGTPRTGATTEPQSLGISFIIKI